MDQLEALQQRLANQRKAREIEDAKDEEEVERVSEIYVNRFTKNFFFQRILFCGEKVCEYFVN